MTPGLSVSLRRQLARLKAEALEAGTSAPRPLFPQGDGRPFDKDALYGAFKRASQALRS